MVKRQLSSSSSAFKKFVELLKAEGYPVTQIETHRQKILPIVAFKKSSKGIGKVAKQNLIKISKATKRKKETGNTATL